MTSILEVKKSVEKIILDKGPLVTGIGLNKDGNRIVIYGRDHRAADGHVHRSKLGGYQTEFYKTGDFLSFAYGFNPMSIFTSPDPNNPVVPDRVRPICGGVGISNQDVGGVGTLASIVMDSNGDPYILSNNHVISGNYSVGTKITQPSFADGGKEESDTIATASNFIPYSEDYNIVDAAIAKVAPGTEFYNGILLDEGGKNYDVITGYRSAKVGERVTKHGRTTGETTGKIIDTDFSTTMPYPNGQRLHFKDQLLIRLDSVSGDSGSIITGKDGNAVGLLIGGSIDESGKRYVVANKIRNVFELLNIKL